MKILRTRNEAKFDCVSQWIVWLQEKISLLRENEVLMKENQRLHDELESMHRNKELTDNQMVVLNKNLEGAHKDLKDRDILVSLMSTIFLQVSFMAIRLTSVLFEGT